MGSTPNGAPPDSDRQGPGSDPEPFSLWRSALSLSAAGAVFVACTGLGALLGFWLDGRFGTKPWLLVSGILLGTVAGFVEIYRFAKRFLR